ncbi:DNA-(apurinic or apyrimidinic site) lyase [Bienertia sinuspersici]
MVWLDWEDFAGFFVDLAGRSGFYGWPSYTEKHLLWALLQSLGEEVRWEGPCLCAGDFNQIMYHEEKLGGPLRDKKLMDEFRTALEDCGLVGLVDLSFVGFKYTWWNGCEGDLSLHQRLDRMIGNKKWVDEFSWLCMHHLDYGGSDHLP